MWRTRWAVSLQLAKLLSDASQRFFQVSGCLKVHGRQAAKHFQLTGLVVLYQSPGHRSRILPSGQFAQQHRRVETVAAHPVHRAHRNFSPAPQFTGYLYRLHAAGVEHHQVKPPAACLQRPREFGHRHQLPVALIFDHAIGPLAMRTDHQCIVLGGILGDAPLHELGQMSWVGGIHLRARIADRHQLLTFNPKIPTVSLAVHLPHQHVHLGILLGVGQFL